MGRISEFINGYRGRTTYMEGIRKTGGYKSNVVEVTGAERVEAIMDKILTTDPAMDRFVKKLIAVATREARNRVSKDIAARIDNDPRKAARAVKYTVYRKMFGSNISILNKRKASNNRVTLMRQTKISMNPTQRGGNRRTRSSETNRYDSYFGSDRGFVLRFLSSGTTPRQTRYGGRGRIAMSGMFGRIAPWQLEQAVSEISDAIVEYIKQQANG